MATQTVTPSVEEIRELLHITPSDTDPFIWETPSWMWTDAEAYGTAGVSESEYERARR